RKKTLPVVLAFERAAGRTRKRLAALFEPAAPLPAENVAAVREILDELGVRALLEDEIASHRGRAVHLLRGVTPLAAPDAIALVERRLISRWGVFNKNQSALLLDRVQDASLARPFPLSLIRDYGVLRLESAGMHSEERITEGLHELAMTRATAFYRALNDSQT